jgi:hypothetical protein
VFSRRSTAEELTKAAGRNAMRKTIGCLRLKMTIHHQNSDDILKPGTRR